MVHEAMFVAFFILKGFKILGSREKSEKEEKKKTAKRLAWRYIGLNHR